MTDAAARHVPDRLGHLDLRAPQRGAAERLRPARRLHRQRRRLIGQRLAVDAAGGGQGLSAAGHRRPDRAARPAALGAGRVRALRGRGDVLQRPRGAPLRPALRRLPGRHRDAVGAGELPLADPRTQRAAGRRVLHRRGVLRAAAPAAAAVAGGRSALRAPGRGRRVRPRARAGRADADDAVHRPDPRLPHLGDVPSPALVGRLLLRDLRVRLPGPADADRAAGADELLGPVRARDADHHRARRPLLALRARSLPSGSSAPSAARRASRRARARPPSG